MLAAELNRVNNDLAVAKQELSDEPVEEADASDPEA